MLAVNELRVSYGQSEVIPNLTFSANKNEIVAIMGRNGMGKTTLFKSLMGILPAKRGTIVLDGSPLGGLAPFERVARGIAYVPQGRMIFPSLTVRENVETGLNRTKWKTVPNEIYELFPVLKEMAGRKGGNLSGGQQQQLAIARALVSDPKVLLLDEPTEGIQPSIIKEIARTLKTIRDTRGITIVVSEQVLSFALDVADRILVLDRGRLIHENKRSEVDRDTVARYLSI